MKTLLLSLTLLASVAAHAADDSLNPLRISSACENEIFKKVVAQCDRDSKNDPSREHGCYYWGQARILRNQADSAYFEADFTVTDAVVYTYGISIEDKARCEFKVVSKN